jgi:hypothetical protein
MEARLFQGGRTVVIELYFILEEPSMNDFTEGAAGRGSVSFDQA